MEKKEIIKFVNVSRIYEVGDKKFKALNKINLTIEEGKFVVILGPSGAGKSTLLNLLGGLDSPTKGKIIVDGVDIEKLTDDKLAEYRASKVGFIFQFYNLIPGLTVYENVKLVHENTKDGYSAEKALEDVGISKHLKKFPSQISGGEQQRVSIARSIAKNTKILLCDEPTGALDSETGSHILKLLHEMTRKNNKTIIVVTHNQKIAEVADVVIRLKNGEINSIVNQKKPKQVESIEW